MAHNLRARLTRIREQRRGDSAEPGTPPAVPPAGGPPETLPVRPPSPPAGTPVSAPPAPALSSSALPAPAPPGWTSAGYRVLCRKLTLPVPDLPEKLPDTLPLLIPDLAPRGGFCGAALSPGQFLFFDLETTGLSGGAGTTAFLAAFGRFTGTAGPGPKRQGPRSAGDGPVLEVTQFLLLDYPGEPDFLEAVLAETGCCSADSPAPAFLTTYNGKSFDTQILKTRCLVNRLAVPPLVQADLLHPARRLWKRILPNCSQATIETMVLGLDRTGDLPGSMAPGIW
ncbi:MAG: ribonuclease H-like domain-containing protein, partial [Treponema sp.]|nr:ribonuclease H-like domain-containing protein [Treponema sp.]